MNPKGYLSILLITFSLSACKGESSSSSPTTQVPTDKTKYFSTTAFTSAQPGTAFQATLTTTDYSGTPHTGSVTVSTGDSAIVSGVMAIPHTINRSFDDGTFSFNLKETYFIDNDGYVLSTRIYHYPWGDKTFSANVLEKFPDKVRIGDSGSFFSSPAEPDSGGSICYCLFASWKVEDAYNDRVNLIFNIDTASTIPRQMDQSTQTYTINANGEIVAFSETYENYGSTLNLQSK